MKTLKSIAAPAILLFASALFVPCAPVLGQTTSPRPTRVRAKLQGFDLSANSGKSANQIGGASRDLGTPRLYAPVHGKDFSLNPTFHWATADGASKVTFRLTTINGVPLYEVTSSGTSLMYPNDAPALKPGDTYCWTVVPENDMMGGAPSPVSFTVVGGNERTQVANEISGSADPASVFVNHRLWYDAVTAYDATLAKTPNDKAALQGQATLYDSISATQPLADADWKMIH